MKKYLHIPYSLPGSGYTIACGHYALYLRIFCLFVFTSLLVLGPDYSFASDSCMTAECHSDLGKSKFVHDPVAGKECDACHVATEKKHPGEKGAFELAEESPALCLQCHDDPGEGKKHTHPPVKEDCTNCHNPYGLTLNCTKTVRHIDATGSRCR